MWLRLLMLILLLLAAWKKLSTAFWYHFSWFIVKSNALCIANCLSDSVLIMIIQLQLHISDCKANIRFTADGWIGQIGTICVALIVVTSCNTTFWQLTLRFCRSMIKVKFSTDKVRRALRSAGGCLLFDWLSPCSKTSKLLYFRPFRPDIQILSALTTLHRPSTAFYRPSTTKYQPVPPYTDPAPPSTNKYCPILTQYHHESTITAFYWQYHQVPTGTAFYCPIIYKPEPLHTDQVPPSIK